MSFPLYWLHRLQSIAFVVCCSRSTLPLVSRSCYSPDSASESPLWSDPILKLCNLHDLQLFQCNHRREHSAFRHPWYICYLFSLCPYRNIGTSFRTKVCTSNVCTWEIYRNIGTSFRNPSFCHHDNINHFSSNHFCIPWN